MAEVATSQGLQLPDLTIRGFRGIKELSISRLGRVSLIAGMNGIGKTTVLDAVSVYADRGSSATLNELLERRDELFEYQDEDGDTVSGIRWSALFYGRHFDDASTISIGPKDSTRRLTMKVRPPTEEELPRLYAGSDSPFDEEQWMLSATIGTQEQVTHLSPIRQRRPPPRWREARRPARPTAISCRTVGPGLLTNQQTQALWTAVALKDAENEAVDALNLVTDELHPIERVAVVGDDQWVPTRTLVRRRAEEEPVPLRSLGDGAVRVFGLALALSNTTHGFLLIDEVENGIHHTVQDQFWSMLLRVAHANDVQVIATTHSWDSVASYARAATASSETNGALIRLETDEDGLFAVEYSEDELSVVAEQGIEVR